MFVGILARLRSIIDSTSLESPRSDAGLWSKSNFKPSRLPTTVEDYLKYRLVAHIQSGNGPEWDQLSKHMVTRLEHRKILENGDKPEHEDIVATIVDHEGIPFRILIERRKYSPGVSGSKYEDDEAEKISSSSFFKFASPIFGKNGANSHTNTTSQEIPIPLAKGSPDASEPGAIDDPLPAVDVVKMLSPSYQYPGHVVVLRVFEPSSHCLSLLRLGNILEAVHDSRPDYHIFRGQAHWFTLTVMGISMQQGGRVKILDQKRGIDPQWDVLNPRASFDLHLAASLNLPTLGIEEVKSPTQEAPAGENSRFVIVKAPFQEICDVCQESQRRYDSLYKTLVARRTASERIEEAEATIHAAEARIREIESQTNEDIAEAKRKIEELHREQEAYKIGIEAANKKAEATLRQRAEYERQPSGKP